MPRAPRKKASRRDDAEPGIEVVAALMRAWVAAAPASLSFQAFKDLWREGGWSDKLLVPKDELEGAMPMAVRMVNQFVYQRLLEHFEVPSTNAVRVGALYGVYVVHQTQGADWAAHVQMGQHVLASVLDCLSWATFQGLTDPFLVYRKLVNDHAIQYCAAVLRPDRFPFTIEYESPAVQNTPERHRSLPADYVNQVVPPAFSGEAERLQALQKQYEDARAMLGIAGPLPGHHRAFAETFGTLAQGIRIPNIDADNARRGGRPDDVVFAATRDQEHAPEILANPDQPTVGES